MRNVSHARGTHLRQHGYVSSICRYVARLFKRAYHMDTVARVQAASLLIPTQWFLAFLVIGAC